MDNRSLISIIVPVYNQENNIDRCLKSISNQKYRNLEIILVDDGSTDSSPMICDKYAKLDSRVNVLHIPNGGVANARNIALDVCQGEYVTFIDSDDFVSEKYVETLYKLTIENDVNVAFCKYNVVNAYDIEKSVFTITDCVVNEVKTIDIFFEYDYGNDYTLRHNWTALYKRDVIGDIRFDTDIYVGEDALFNAKVMIKTSRIACTTEVLYYYVHYSASASHGFFDIKKSTVIEAWYRIIEIYKDKPFSFLQGCYQSFAQECHNGMRSLLKKKFDKFLFIKTKKALQWVFPYIRKSNWSIPKKICYFLVSRIPKIYYALR